MWDVTAEADTPILTLVGHAGFVRSVAFSPDGTRIAAGGGDYAARVWDAQTGLEIAAFRGHAGVIYTLVFSPGGRRLVTGSEGRPSNSRTSRATTTLVP